jgi:hypothetical protein
MSCPTAMAYVAYLARKSDQMASFGRGFWNLMNETTKYKGTKKKAGQPQMN